MKNTILKSLQNTISYQDYRELVSSLLAEGKSTGPNQSEELTHYSRLNDSRMKRLDKRIKIKEDVSNTIASIATKQTWLVITEGWCGDAAQNLPVLHKLAELNPNIKLKLVLRDEHLELMDLFLTNGGRSIPKLISLDENEKVLFTWGPRPSLASKMVQEYKKNHGALDATFKQDLQVWYNKDKGFTLQNDIKQLLEKAPLHKV